MTQRYGPVASRTREAEIVARRSVVSALPPPLKAEEIRELVSRNNYRKKI